MYVDNITKLNTVINRVQIIYCRSYAKDIY